jgi:O-antigen ligase
MLMHRRYGSRHRQAQHILFGLLLALAMSFMVMNTSLFSEITSLYGVYGRWVLLMMTLVSGLALVQANQGTWRWCSVDSLLLLMLVIFGLSTWNSEQPARSWLLYSLYWVEVIAIVYIPRTLELRLWRRLFGGMAVIATLAAWLALKGYATGSEEYDCGGRLGTAMMNPNSVGMSCMLAILFGWTLVCTQRGWSRWAFVVGQVVLLLVLYLTGSRSSIIGTLVGSVYALVLLRRWWVAILASLIIPVVMLVMAVVQNIDLSSREAILADMEKRVVRAGREGDLFSGRRYSWDLAFAFWRVHPWLGNGFGVTDPYDPRPIDGSGYHGMLASVGVVGVATFILPVFLLLWKVGKASRHPCWEQSLPVANDPREIMALGSAPVVGLLVQGAGEPWMIGVGSLMTFTFMLGVGGCLSALMWFQRGGWQPAPPHMAVRPFPAHSPHGPSGLGGPQRFP